MLGQRIRLVLLSKTLGTIVISSQLPPPSLIFFHIVEKERGGREKGEDIVQTKPKLLIRFYKTIAVSQKSSSYRAFKKKVFIEFKPNLEIKYNANLYIIT